MNYKGSIKKRLVLIIMTVTLLTSFTGYGAFLAWYMNNQQNKVVDLAHTVGLILGQDIAKLILLNDVSLASDITSKLKSFLKFANLLSRFCSRVVLPTFENGFYKKSPKNLQKKFANRFRYKNPPFGRFHFYHKAQKILVHSFHKCDKIEGYRVFHLLTLLVFGLVF